MHTRTYMHTFIHTYIHICAPEEWHHWEVGSSVCARACMNIAHVHVHVYYTYVDTYHDRACKQYQKNELLVYTQNTHACVHAQKGKPAIRIYSNKHTCKLKPKS
jgi:hypothetical protein